MSYETKRLAHREYAMSLMPEYVSRLFWSRAQIEAEQTRALHALLQHAVLRSPWHRERLRYVELEDITPARIGELPSMTKQDLMASWDAIVTEPGCTLVETEAHLERMQGDAYLRGDLHVVASGGSSGERGVFVYGWHGWAVSFVGVSRAFRLGVAHPDPSAGATLASVAAHHATHASSAVGQTFSNPALPTLHAPVTWPIDRIVATLNEGKPAVVMAYASMLPVLAEEARAGRLSIRPSVIYSTAEPLLPELREAAESVWGPCVRNLFATSESIGGAFPCPSGSGFHVGEDVNLIELVDEQGVPVAPGERSARVLLTNLYNPSLPLIRYEISDEFELARDPCPCGSSYLKVNDVHGRADDVFTYAGDVHVHPLGFRSSLGRRPAIVAYQVRQTLRGAEIDVTTRGELDLAMLAAELEERLHELGVSAPEVSVRRVGELARQHTGKLKRFVALAR